MLAQHDAKIQDHLGDRKVGKPLWGIFFGIELEYEIDKATEFAMKNPSVSTEIPGQYENSPYVHFVADTLTEKHLKKLDCFAKRDGSMKDGVEIVTLPIAFSEIAGADGKGAKKWHDFFNDFKQYGLVVRATCGMHVHVSRELLTTLQIGKILRFLHDEKNRDFIKTIAGRTPPDKYAKFTDAKKVTDVSRHTNRYDSLNLTGFNTIEFRLFKSTTSLERVLANIEFCDVMINFSWPSVVSIQHHNLENLLNFIRSKRKSYPNLFGLLVAKGYFGKPRVIPKTLAKNKKENIIRN